MNKFKSVFNKKHVFLPVIHVENLDKTLKNIEIAYSAKCDGVFLINHAVSSKELLEIQYKSKEKFPDFWIGVNLLGEMPLDIFQMLNEGIDGLWVDNAYIDEKENEQKKAEQILSAKLSSGWKGLYFGGVAFKYQKKVSEVEKAAILAKDFMDVVTTSGIGTGKAANIEKIKLMKSALGDFPLAIASGISYYNIEDYLDIADCFLVASSITSNNEYLKPKTVFELKEKIQRYENT
jgi:2-keto-3-deoxy-6-phosphogluconate aldolase